jgi:hypothetical protein
MDKSNILNILFHVLILFTFLTIFFFTYISSTEKSATDSAINDMINSQGKTILAELDGIDVKIGKQINWDTMEKIAQDEVNSTTNYDITEDGVLIVDNNNKLFWISIFIIIGIVVAIICYSLWLKYYVKEDLHIGELLGENLIIFSIVGTIEFLFFVFIVSKYVPTTPDIIGITAIEKIKENIKN